jgi:hypothetical protein
MTVAQRESTAQSEEPLQFELDPELQELLRAHRGEWVAITRTELIASGADAAKVLEQARRQGVDSPMLVRVPDDEVIAHYF